MILANLHAFMTLHLIHFLANPANKDATYKYMPHDSSDIIQNVPSFMTTLQLFPNQQFQRRPCIYPYILPIHLTINNTAKAHPTMNILSTMARLPFLPSLILRL
jgi:cytochrome bd-type quinol oxidase subunit 2